MLLDQSHLLQVLCSRRFYIWHIFIRISYWWTKDFRIKSW